MAAIENIAVDAREIVEREGKKIDSSPAQRDRNMIIRNRHFHRANAFNERPRPR